MMKGGSGSRIPSGMMSFVTNGRKNDTTVVKDEDLTLFKDLKNRSNQQKQRNLLLHPLCLSDEFDTANGPFPSHPNGNYQIFRIPSAKKGADFLAENDKHDYDWLKTPPATPLFPSIEMEATNNNGNNNAPHGQQHLLQQGPLQQPLSRFAGGNNSEVSARPRTNNINGNIIQKPAHNQKPKLLTTPKNDVVPKRPSASTSTSTSTKTSSSRSCSTSSKERPYHHNIVGFSNEKPPNLRTEQRSSSTTRGRAAIAPPRVEEVTAAKPTKQRQKSCSPTVARGRKPEPIIANNKPQENKGSVVLGSRMVEKVINARKSASAANINNTSSTIVSHRLKDTKPDYSRPTNQKSAFGLSRNGNMITTNKTLISREKTRSK